MELPKLDERAAFVLFWGALFLIVIASNVLAYTITPIAYDNGIPTTVRISENGETFATLKILNKLGMDEGRLWIQDCGAWNCKVKTEVNFTHDTAYSAGLFTGIVEYEQATFFDKLTRNITWQEPYESPIWVIQNISMSEEEIGCIHNCEETCEAYPYYGEWESNICYVSSALTREELGCHQDCEDVCESPPYYGEWKSDLCYVYLGYYAEELGCEEEVCSEICEADPYYGDWNGVSCDVQTEVLDTETIYRTLTGWEAIPNGFVFSPTQTYTLGFDYVRSDARDIADLKPVLFGQPVHLWAWWDLTNIVNITSCGTYDENNTYYQLTNDISIPDNNQTCLLFTGANNTINGGWHTLLGSNGGWDASNYGYIGVVLQNTNNTLENFTITDMGIGLYSGNTSNTIRFAQVNSTGLGVYADVGSGTANNYLTSISLWNNTYGIYLGAASAGTTVSNINSYGSTSVDAYFLNATLTDGGSNYWKNCSGQCGWYAINRTTQEWCAESYIVSGTNPSTNKYCSSGTYSEDNKTGFIKFRTYANPPARIIVANYNLSVYGVSEYGGGTSATWYSSKKDFNSSVNYTNQDSYKSTASVVGGAFANAWAYYPFNNFGYNQSGWAAQDYMAQYGGIPTYLEFSYDTLTQNVYFYATCTQAANSPNASIKWRPSFGNYTSPFIIQDHYTQNGTRIESYAALSLYNATYCSHPTRNITGAIYEVFDYASGTKLDIPVYSARLNSTHNWATFACSPNTFYSLSSTIPYFNITNGSCPTNYSNVYNFTFYDGDTLANLTVNTSTTLAMEIGDYNYSLTKIFNDTQRVSVCKSDFINPIFDGSVFIRFNATGYNTRTMTYTAANTTNTSKELYLSNMAARYAYTFKTINSFNLAVPNATIQIYHYNVADSEYILIDQMNTGFDGASVSYLLLAEPYRIVASAEGYNTLTLDYTTTTITTITITLTPTATGNMSSTDYESMWHDTSFNFTPTGYYYQPPKNVSFQVACDDAFIEYYGMEITRYYNGTNQTVSVLNQSGLSTGGTLQVQLNDTGDYRIQVWFKRENYTEYRPLPYKIYLAERSGLGEVMNIFATKEPISGWGYYLFALLITTVVAGFVSRYTVDGAGVIGLIVLWMLTLIYPMAILTCIGATCINIAMATGLTTLLVGAVMLLRWYI